MVARQRQNRAFENEAAFKNDLRPALHAALLDLAFVLDEKATDMDALATAQRQLLDDQGLSLSSLETALNRAMGPGITSSDLYFQFSRQENWGLEDGIVKEGSHSIEQGVGVRAVSGEKVGFAYSDELSDAALEQAANSARAIARSGQSGSLKAWQRREAAPLYQAFDPIESLAATQKVELLRELDAYARSLDPRVVQVMAGVSASVDTVLIAASDGTFAGDVRPLIHLRITVIVEQQGRREVGSSGGGGRFSRFLTGHHATLGLDPGCELFRR